MAKKINNQEKLKISAIILYGGNVDKKLYQRCTKSLKFVDEIVQLNTSSLITKKKERASFAEWRNIATKKAKNSWLLYIDTDEEILPALRNEIIRTVKEDDPRYSGYAIKRKNILLGKHLQWGGWGDDYVIRLIRRKDLIRWEGELHEQPKVKKEIEKLNSELLHTSHRNITDMLSKTNAWSEIEAELLFKAHHPPMTVFRFTSVALREVWQRGVLKLGFLDGTVGIIEIIYQMYSRLITYSKLWEKQQSITRT